MATNQHATILDSCSVEVPRMVGPHHLIIMSHNKIIEIQSNLHKYDTLTIQHISHRPNFLLLNYLHATTTTVVKRHLLARFVT